MKFFKAVIDWVKRLHREYPEWWGLPVSFVAFYFMSIPLLWLDPESRPWPVDTLSALLLAVVMLLAGNAVVFLGVQLNHKSEYSWYRNHLKGGESSFWQFYAVLALYLLAYVGILNAVM